MTNVLLRLVRDAGGQTTVAALLKRAGTKREASYLENADNWISLDEACALLEAAVGETGDARFARRVGESTLRQHAGTQVATLLRSLGSVEAILGAVAQTAAKFSTVTELEAVEVGPGHAVIRAAARDGFTRRSLLCEWTSGLLSAGPGLFGLPFARVEETECQTRGDAQCSYAVSWDAELAAAAADPQQRVTALEAQLASVSERLQSAYATASDLVSTEELDTVLHRIVERAADAVRAPGFVLAVRPEPGSDLQVYSHGIDSRHAAVLVRGTRERTAPVSDSTLAVEVTSSRHHYGQLIAQYPGQIRFFPQDREALGLYAKHAAAVLDMTTALQESAQRNAEVSLLLSLAHAAAQAGTSEEIGKRLAAAVPDVVDCDRTAVWQWDESSQCVRFLAGLGQTAEQEASLRQLTISPNDTPHLRAMITEPEPKLVDADSDDPFMSQLLVALDIAAMVLVPIVARDVFLGLLIVIAVDRPQRLRLGSELLDQLKGIAALAAPAIQNGLLVDELRYKASHDALTGLLNRAGFRQSIDRTVGNGGEEGAPNGQVGLLFIDLDDFKRVNDLHGHDFGDALLCQAADRLAAIRRGGDEVARLGGDEFAVILAEVDHEDQVRLAEQRVRAAFVKPFRIGDAAVSIGASIGGVAWPADAQTVNELVRRADEAMYRDKTQGRRPHVGASPVGA